MRRRPATTECDLTREFQRNSTRPRAALAPSMPRPGRSRMKRRAATTPLADALERVGDRWTLLVVAALLDGPKRFNELQDELDGIAPNVLSSRLKALTEQALIVAQPYSERPPRFAYELSESGRELAGALRLLADWGARSGGARALPARRRAARRSRRAGGARRAGSSSTTPMTTTSSTSEADTSAPRCRRARRGRARTRPPGRSTPARTTRAAARPASCDASISRAGPKHSSACATYRATSPQASHAVSASIPIDTFIAMFGRAASARTRAAHGSIGPPSTGGRARWSTTIRSSGTASASAHTARACSSVTTTMSHASPRAARSANSPGSSQSSGSRPTSRRTPTQLRDRRRRSRAEPRDHAGHGRHRGRVRREPRVVLVGLDQHGRVGDRAADRRGSYGPAQLRVQRRRRPEVVMRVDDHLRSTRAASICESSAATGTSTSTSRAASTTSHRSLPHGRYFTGVPPASS